MHVVRHTRFIDQTAWPDLAATRPVPPAALAAVFLRPATTIWKALRIALVLTLLACTAASARATAPATPQSAPRVVAQREIIVPGVHFLSLSPNGRWLAGVSPMADPTHGRLCVYVVATLKPRACADLAGLTAGFRLDSLVWAPDSTRLAFDEDVYAFLRGGNVWVMDAATGTLTNVTHNRFLGKLPLSLFPSATPTATPIDLDVSPAWSPDGSTLAFFRTTLRNGALQRSELDRIPAVGGTPQTVVAIPGTASDVTTSGLAWSPDGTRLYYPVEVRDAKAPVNGLWVVNSNGKAAHRLVASDASFGPPSVVEVAARGDRALVVYPVAAGQFATTGTVFAQVDLATGKTQKLTLDLPGVPPFAFAALATFSPDGTRLLLVTGGMGADHWLLVRDVNGGVATRLGAPMMAAQMTPLGHGLNWGADGTVFVAGNITTATLLRVV